MKDVPALPDDHPELFDAIRKLLAACNGFVYAGSDSEAQLRAIRWLRANPEDAKLIIGVSPSG